MFVSEVSMQEAQMARTEMNGKMAFGRPLVVRYACEKYFMDAKDRRKCPFDLKNTCSLGSVMGQMIQIAKIAAIMNKLKALEQEGCGAKKLKGTNFSSGHKD
ncbi:hypothetical protein KSP39_PZI011693 [Platanthera zijinensis]|uniref:Uncharacterized protein n=1 Tax=Platanthera zijinensis TaxID=2320716 RepID=A0AAP0BID6_9ASPA